MSNLCKMNKLLFPLLFLTVFLVSCTSNDEPDEVLNCEEDLNKNSMTRFVKTDSKSNGVTNSYNYNELNLLESRTRKSSNYSFEYAYVYDCSNNLTEVNVDETLDPQYDGSDSFYEYDAQNRLASYRSSFQGEDDYSFTYEGDIVSVAGSFVTGQNAVITLQLNSQGQVTRLDRNTDIGFIDEVIHTKFEYDNNGNLIKADDYDQDGNLIYSIRIYFDNNTNPYYDQFKSIYLQKFVNLFYDTGYWAADVITSDAFIFPYMQNNITGVVDILCNNCYPEVVKRVYQYDEQVYPNKFSLSYWGAPGTETELEYYE
jgi:hypothetical protein